MEIFDSSCMGYQFLKKDPSESKSSKNYTGLNQDRCFKLRNNKKRDKQGSLQTLIKPTCFRNFVKITKCSFTSMAV